MKSITLKHISLLIVLSLIWGSSFTAVKVAVVELTPIEISFFRVLCAAITLVFSSLFFTLTLPKLRSNWFILLLIALFSSAVPFTLIGWASVRDDSSTISILMATSPIFALLASHFFTTDDKLTLTKVASVLLGFCGVMILLAPGIGNLMEGKVLAKLATLLAALSYVFSGILTRKLTEDIGAPSIACLVLVLSTLILTPFMLQQTVSFDLDLSSTTLIAILYLGIVATAIAQLVRYSLILEVGYSFVSYIGFLIPIFAVFLGAYFLNERLDSSSFIALALVLTALALPKSGSIWRHFRTPQKTVKRD